MKLFLKVTASLGYNNIDTEQGGKEYTERAALLLLLIDATVLTMILFAASVWILL